MGAKQFQEEEATTVTSPEAEVTLTVTIIAA